MLYSLFRPAVFLLDGERAHRTTIAALKALPHGGPPAIDPRLAMTVAGVDFAGPVGLAPGFDKDAEVPAAMLAMGFASVELGTVTPRPQPGNPRPRLFRLIEDRAVINRMGFNNAGAPAFARRLAKARPLAGPVGINIGANKDSTDRIADYVALVSMMAPLADYLTVNISSPNTPGLRGLQDSGALAELLSAVMAARAEHNTQPPVFLKLAPDLDDGAVKDIVRIAMDQGIHALIISNTTITRPMLGSRFARETGGLSGAPLRALALDRLRAFRRESGGAIPLIGVGGIASAADAYARIRAGASLVQIYSALVYEGPDLAKRIHSELPALLDRDGFATLADAMGVDAR